MTLSKPHSKTKRNAPRPIGQGKPNSKNNWTCAYLAICAGLLGFSVLADIYLILEPLITSGVLGSNPKGSLVAFNASNALNPWI